MIAGIGLCLSSSGRAQNQQVYLPNPTPRDPDLFDKYKDDPMRQAVAQKAALLRQTQLRQQTLIETDRLAQLAQQLKENIKRRKPGDPLEPDALTAGEIEKLAKKIKSAMKSQ